MPNPKAYETPGEISLTNAWTSRVQKNYLKVLVEGKSDVRFYKKFIRSENLYPVVDETNNNKKIKQTVKLEEERYRQGLTKQIILGIVDSDFDRLKSLATPSDNIFATDTHDLETMIIKSAAFDATLRKFFKIDSECTKRAESLLRRLGKTDVRSALLSYTLGIGLLKLTVCENCLCIDYDLIVIDEYINEQFEFDQDRVIAHVAKLSQVLTPSELVHLVEEMKKRDYDEWMLCNGHDMVKAFTIFLNAVLPIDGPFAEDKVSSTLLKEYSLADFRKTNLFAAITNWERRNAGFRVIEAQ